MGYQELYVLPYRADTSIITSGRKQGSMPDTLCVGKTLQQPKEAMGQAAIQSPSAAFEMGVTQNGHVFPFDYSLPLKTRGSKCSLQAKSFFFLYYLMARHS